MPETDLCWMCEERPITQFCEAEDCERGHCDECEDCDDPEITSPCNYHTDFCQCEEPVSRDDTIDCCGEDCDFFLCEGCIDDPREGLVLCSNCRNPICTTCFMADEKALFCEDHDIDHTVDQGVHHFMVGAMCGDCAKDNKECLECGDELCPMVEMKSLLEEKDKLAAEPIEPPTKKSKPNDD